MTEHEFRTGTPDPASTPDVTLDDSLVPLFWTKKPVTIEAVRYLDIMSPAMIRFDRADGLPDWIDEAIGKPANEVGALWPTWDEAGQPMLWLGAKNGTPWPVEPGEWIIRRHNGMLMRMDDEQFQSEFEPAMPPVPEDGEVEAIARGLLAARDGVAIES